MKTYTNYSCATRILSIARCAAEDKLKQICIFVWNVANIMKSKEKGTQELIQSDPHQAPYTKGKVRQIH